MPFQCDKCEKNFRVKSNLIVHTNKFHPIQKLRDTFSCDIAEKIVIPNNKSMNSLQCGKCHNTFTEQEDLETHILQMNKPIVLI